MPKPAKTTKMTKTSLLPAAEGNLASVHSLLAYGANPNADLSKLIVPETSGGFTLNYPSSGSILAEAAKSGNPDLIREILHYQPKLELKNQYVDTALLVAATYQYSDYNPVGARAECVHLPAKSGANVNAHWEDGNTALHKPRDQNVTAALIELGADVNARNNDGETPLFTTEDIESIQCSFATEPIPISGTKTARPHSKPPGRINPGTKPCSLPFEPAPRRSSDIFRRDSG
jgi:hypothetical protein